MQQGAVALSYDDYYPPRQHSSRHDEESRSTTLKWAIGLFLVAATIILLVPLWRIALHNDPAVTTSAATAPDDLGNSSVIQDSTRAPSPSTAPPHTMAPTSPTNAHTDAPSQGSYPFVFPNPVRTNEQDTTDTLAHVLGRNVTRTETASDVCIPLTLSITNTSIITVMVVAKVILLLENARQMYVGCDT